MKNRQLTHGLLAVCLGTFIFTSTVFTASAANAGTLSLGDTTVTWDDNLVLRPTDRCVVVPFTAKSTGTVRPQVNLNFKGADGSMSRVTIYLKNEGDGTATELVNLCPNSFPSPPYVHANGDVIVEAKSMYFGTAADQTASATLTFGPPAVIKAISPQNEVCRFDSGMWNADLCAEPFYLRLDDAENWTSGDTGSIISLYNKKGKVPTVDVSPLVTDDLAQDGDSQLIRIKKGSLPKGNYLLVAKNVTLGKWSCSVYYESVCNWSDDSKQISGWTFSWNGQEVTRIKWVKARNIQKVRL